MRRKCATENASSPKFPFIVSRFQGQGTSIFCTRYELSFLYLIGFSQTQFSVHFFTHFCEKCVFEVLHFAILHFRFKNNFAGFGFIWFIHL